MIDPRVQAKSVTPSEGVMKCSDVATAAVRQIVANAFASFTKSGMATLEFSSRFDENVPRRYTYHLIEVSRTFHISQARCI